MQPTDRTDSKGERPTVSHGSASRRSGNRFAAAKVATDGHPDDLGDMDRYLVHVAHLDMALPLKIELIRSLRVMMQSFVDRAFGDDPVQLAGNKGRNKSDTGENGDVISSPPIPNSNDNLTSGFRRIAEPCEEKETDR